MQSAPFPAPSTIYERSGTWVVCDEQRALHVVPGCRDGWRIRRPYRGHVSPLTLRPVSTPRILGWCLGVPFAQQLT